MKKKPKKITRIKDLPNYDPNIKVPDSMVTFMRKRPKKKEKA